MADIGANAKSVVEKAFANMENRITPVKTAVCVDLVPVRGQIFRANTGQTGAFARSVLAQPYVSMGKICTIAGIVVAQQYVSMGGLCTIARNVVEQGCARSIRYGSMLVHGAGSSVPC